MVVPLVIGAVALGSSIVGTGTYFGLKGSGNTINNRTKKISYQTNNTNKISNFEFNGATFERDSSFLIRDALNATQSNSSTQKDNLKQEDKDSLSWLLLAGAGVAVYFLVRGDN